MLLITHFYANFQYFLPLGFKAPWSQTHLETDMEIFVVIRWIQIRVALTERFVFPEKLSLLRERRSVDYWMFQDYMKKTKDKVPENERCTYVVTPQSFLVHGIAFAYPKDSKLGKLFDPL